VAGDVPARLYRHSESEANVFVWLHGGGWTTGDVAACDSLSRHLSNSGGCAVLAVDYRLAPEHPYPAAVDDAWAASVWASTQFRRVAVGGDSAGGNLAAAVALRAHAAGIDLDLQLLVYPVLADRTDSEEYRTFAERYEHFAGRAGLGADELHAMKHIWSLYVPDPEKRSEPDAAPLRAVSLAGVAPAMMIFAEHDILRGEGEEYARRLRGDGVPVVERTSPGQIHGFFHMIGVMDDARAAADEAAAALRRAFSS
jgi:acetyl esterase